MQKLLDDVKEYLRVDSNDENTVIENYIEAAKTYIENGTGKTFDEKNSQMLLVVKMLCGHWYDNRNVVGGGGELPFTITSLLLQIEHKKEG